MLGPALLKFGNEAQKREHLPKIARGEIRWCQGYSEPNAGSDLASLATRAEDRGDHYLVNGQKIWTSYADKADWIFCLVRTDSAAKKHTGISFVLFDMATPGVSTQPITLISGKSPFCETFFDNVRVEKHNLVGQPGGGWDVAKYLLTHEREMIGAIGDRSAVAAAGRDGRAEPGPRRARPARRPAAARAHRRVRGRRSRLPRADAALRRTGARQAGARRLLVGAEVLRRRAEQAPAGADHVGAGQRRAGMGGRNGSAARDWLRSKANSIEGGTSEVQLNVIAKRILELPGA